MAKFAIGDKVHQASSNHAEGTVVAIFTDRASERRYAVEMFGHRTIQIGNEGNLVAHGSPSFNGQYPRTEQPRPSGEGRGDALCGLATDDPDA